MPLDESEFKALSLFDRTINQTEEIRIVPFVGDPSVVGFDAPVGSVAIRTDGFVHQKIAGTDTDWTQGAQLGVPSTGGTLPLCVPFCLADGTDEGIELDVNQVPFCLADGTPDNFDLVSC